MQTRNGWQPKLLCPWQVRPASKTTLVIKTRRGRKRTVRTFAHFLDSSYRMLLEFRTDRRSYTMWLERDLFGAFVLHRR